MKMVVWLLHLKGIKAERTWVTLEVEFDVGMLPSGGGYLLIYGRIYLFLHEFSIKKKLS
jgi:hypothetical protein